MSRTEASIEIKATRSFRSRPANSTLFGGRRDLPVLGRAQGGSDGNIVIEDGAIDWTFRPADLQGVRDAFAVYVTGNSMVPKYKDKDLAYVHPSKTPRRGRYVLVETQGHRGFIKQFDRWDGDTLVLQQYNPAEEIRIPRADILRVMLVIGSLDG
ncbi:S24 family peptidase [Kordiimonas marina]|uniref:S24 family peptidase n=1 Tax=Kordiimonas marina TaxID=2872312 RepID=UPI001FF5ABF5|nr:S24 family peptidase [Kordiimonas marina]MCJ9430170.1 S24 family peptidase [Kordiimonas marina]